MKIVKWFIDSHIWIAFGAIGLSSFTYSFLGKSFNWNIAGLLFFATILTYNGQSFLKWATLKKKGNYQEHKTRVITMMIIGFIGLVPLTISFQLENLKVLLILAPLCFLYAFKVPVKTNASINLRSIPFIKVYLIAIVWVVSCIMFPILYENIELQFQHIALLLIFFFYLIGITIPFDIRDIKYDSTSLKTIPQLIGVEKAKILAISLLLISIGIVAFLMIAGYMKFNLGVLSISLFAGSIFLVMRCNESKNGYYYTGYIDGTMILFFLSYFL